MNVLNEFFALRWTPWYRWHPQLAIRYLPVVEWIRRFERTVLGVCQGRSLSILEVGSGGLGIAPYLKQPVTGVDIKFDPPVHPLLAPVVGDATKLKFSDSSFRIALSIDMLEHLTEKNRSQAICEMVRVARDAVIIGVPCGQESENQDQLLRGEYRKRHGKDFPFLKEQTEYGLPDQTDIISFIKEASRIHRKIVHIDQKGNERLDLRAFFMKQWMKNDLFLNIIFRKLFLFFIPFLRMLERPPYYRQIFFINIESKK